MNYDEKLKSIKNKFDIIKVDEYEWLITRVEKLTSALELIAFPGTQSLYECRSTARKALEEE